MGKRGVKASPTAFLEQKGPTIAVWPKFSFHGPGVFRVTGISYKATQTVMANRTWNSYLTALQASLFKFVPCTCALTHN